MTATSFSIPVSNRFEILTALKEEEKSPASGSQEINFSPCIFDKKTNLIVRDVSPLTARENTWNWKQMFLFSFALFNVATSAGVVAAKNENAVAESSACPLKEYFPHHLENHKPALPSSISGLMSEDHTREITKLLAEKISQEKTFFGKLMQAVGGPEYYSNLPRLNKAEIKVNSETGAPEVSLSALKDEPIKIGMDQYGRSLIAYKYTSKMSSSKANIGILYQKYTSKEIWTAKNLPVNSFLVETDVIHYMQIFNGLHSIYELTCNEG